MINYREAKKMARQYSGLVEAYAVDPYAFARVEMVVPAKLVVQEPRLGPPSIMGMGWAKKHPLDEWNAERGATIARGRAEAHVARQWMQRLKEEEDAKSEESQGKEEVEGLSDGSAD